MIETMHLGSMLPATLGACCVAGSADRRSPLAWFGMLAMLAAMADTMLLPHPVVAPVVWAALLVATGSRPRWRSGCGGWGGVARRAQIPPMARIPPIAPGRWRCTARCKRS